MNLQSRPTIFADGVVLEATLDKRQGIVASCIVQNGYLKVGDCIVAGDHWGRVKKLISDSGSVIEEAGPSTPVQVINSMCIRIL